MRRVSKVLGRESNRRESAHNSVVKETNHVTFRAGHLARSIPFTNFFREREA